LRISDKKLSLFIDAFIGFSLKKHPCNKKRNKIDNDNCLIKSKIKKPLKAGVF
jgi:hypothetical protein